MGVFEKFLNLFRRSPAPQGEHTPAVPPREMVQTAGVVLYQPEADLRPRIAVRDLSAYIGEFQRVLKETFQNAQTPETLDVVVMVRPGGGARVWFVSSLQNGSQKRELETRLEALPVPEVRLGPIAFALCLSIAGARRTDEQGGRVPMPQAWRDAAERSDTPLTIPDGLVDKVWNT